jgi:DNA-binding CsgD family transcriptional regulator
VNELLAEIEGDWSLSADSAELSTSLDVGLVGRGEEVSFLRSFLARTAGGALLVTGDAGVGKTAVLEVAAAAAADAAVRVVRAAGTAAEADVSFSGLNQLLVPLLGDAEGIGAACRDVLLGALGLRLGGPAADRLVVFSAALAVLRQAAERHPLLVVVDDAQWLDQASAMALGFVARRLSGTRVGLLAGLRTDGEGFFDTRGLAELGLRPLAGPAAEALVRSRFPFLAAGVRERVLGEAQGNPLALLELPAELSPAERAGLQELSPTLPLSRRLREAFGARVGALPAATRRLLLLTALEGTGDLAVVVAGGSLEDLVPAERLRLVRIDEGTGRLAFLHPLIRSAVVDSSTASERHRCHCVLADLLPDPPDRRAWHLAQASTGPDPRLLTQARGADPGSAGSLRAASAAAYLALKGDGNIDAAYRLLIGAINDRASDDADDLALAEALRMLLAVCVWAERPRLWASFDAVIARLGTHLDPVLDLEVRTLADPVRTAPTSLTRLDHAIDGLPAELDPTRIIRVAAPLMYLRRSADHREPLWRVIQDGRQGGAVPTALTAMVQLCFDDFVTGRWDEALSLAEEGLRLGDSYGYVLGRWPLEFVRALIAAARGDYATADNLAGQMIRWGAPRGIGGLLTFARHVRTLAALSRGDFDESYQQVTAISPAGTFPSHLAHALLVPMYLVEAAVRTGRRVDAAAHVAAMKDAKIGALSPRLALLAAGSAAIAAPPADAQRLFTEALALPGIDRWPFDAARVRLAFGEQLRRMRATTEARIHLAAALETFQWLGAQPWAARAACELRATGQADRSASRPASAGLTPQELQIAQLAAAGLTNKQIAGQLFLSPRTVSFHLYRIFPRLGISTRAALRDALNRDLAAANLAGRAPGARRPFAARGSRVWQAFRARSSEGRGLLESLSVRVGS